MLATKTITSTPQERDEDCLLTYATVTEFLVNQSEQSCTIVFPSVDRVYRLDTHVLLDEENDHLASEFARLTTNWRAESSVLSSARQMANIRSYQRIIEMGDKAIPFILEDLRTNLPDHWFVALHEITGANPVPEEYRGRLSEMAEAWIKWGEEHGYI